MTDQDRVEALYKLASNDNFDSVDSEDSQDKLDELEAVVELAIAEGLIYVDELEDLVKVVKTVMDKRK